MRLSRKSDVAGPAFSWGFSGTGSGSFLPVSAWSCGLLTSQGWVALALPSCTKKDYGCAHLLILTKESSGAQFISVVHAMQWAEWFHLHHKASLIAEDPFQSALECSVLAA